MQILWKICCFMSRGPFINGFVIEYFLGFNASILDTLEINPTCGMKANVSAIKQKDNTEIYTSPNEEVVRLPDNCHLMLLLPKKLHSTSMISKANSLCRLQRYTNSSIVQAICSN